jgi:hypothetical protein
VLAHYVGWRRIIFLDDDISVAVPGDLRRAARLLDQYAAVGLAIVSFPDGSVATHAYRQIGGTENKFLAAGALALEPASRKSYPGDEKSQHWSGAGWEPAAVCPSASAAGHCATTEYSWASSRKPCATGPRAGSACWVARTPCTRRSCAHHLHLVRPSRHHRLRVSLQASITQSGLAAAVRSRRGPRRRRRRRGGPARRRPAPGRGRGTQGRSRPRWSAG